MSIKIINALFNYPPCKGGELLLLVDMVRHGHDDGTSIYPSVGRLMRETAQCRRAVETQLASLIAKGILIVVKRQTATPTLYRLCMEKVNFDPPPGSKHPAVNAGVDPSKVIHTPHILPKDPALNAKTPAPNADDSLYPLSIRKSAARVEKEQVKSNVNPAARTTGRSPAGDQALSHISAFLPTMKRDR